MNSRLRPSLLTEGDSPLIGGGLRPVNNLKALFRRERNIIAGNSEGITRDEGIAQNLMRLLFCKLEDEKNGGKPQFIVAPGESDESVAKRINALFEKIKQNGITCFEPGERIDLPPPTVASFVSHIQEYAITGADRDVIGDAFEELISVAFRGGSGQFFTPRNVVQMMIDILSPQTGERIIDPACGSGGFIVTCLRFLVKNNAANFAVVGIDKDSFLAKLAHSYCSVFADKGFSVFNENSLGMPSKWGGEARTVAAPGTFDLVLTNPPFGAKIPVMGTELLSQYNLARQWRQGDIGWQETNRWLSKQPPQVLFIERCLQFLRDGGRMGIVLPEGIFGNPSEGYIWKYVESHAKILGVVSLPMETFQPSTHTKTSVLFLEKNKKGKNNKVFMSLAAAVGHDKNGKVVYKMDGEGEPIKRKDGEAIINDDLPEISRQFAKRNNSRKQTRLGFWVNPVNHIYIPEYYSPDVESQLARLRKSGNFNLASIGDLINDGLLTIGRGDEIGSKFYGTGDIPFVRTTDIVNWEIKIDTVKTVSPLIYRRYQKRQDIRPKDILFVSDGTFLIGRSAMVTALDQKIVIQSHIRKIRVLDEQRISPYYLFYLLNTKIVRRQIEMKTFVQATISTLGRRLHEIVLPMHKDALVMADISRKVKKIIDSRATCREQIMETMQSDPYSD